MRIPLYLAVAQWVLLLALGILVIIAYRQLGRVLGQAGQPAELGPPPGSRPGQIAYLPLGAAAGPGPAVPAARRRGHRAAAGRAATAPPGGLAELAAIPPGGLAELAAMMRPREAPDETPDEPGCAHDVGWVRDPAAPAAPPAPGEQAPGGDSPEAGRPDGTRDGVRVFVPGQGQPALVAFVDPTCPACEELVTALTQARLAGELAGLRVLLLTSDPPAYLQISAAFRDTPLEIGRPLDQADTEPYRPNATPLLVALTADGVVARAGTAARAAEVRAFSQACLLAVPPEALLPVIT